jgi:oxygen-independent coproporphyrinogen-3 oxidase
MGKMISVSFYFGEINLPSFQHKFGIRLEEAFPAEVAYVLDNELMEYETMGDPTLRLTQQGEMSYNGVIALFYAGAVKAHLLSLGKAGSPVHVPGGSIKENPLIYTNLHELTLE